MSAKMGHSQLQFQNQSWQQGDQIERIFALWAIVFFWAAF
jgi:hypothetical protein